MLHDVHQLVANVLCPPCDSGQVGRSERLAFFNFLKSYDSGDTWFLPDNSDIMGLNGAQNVELTAPKIDEKIISKVSFQKS